MKSDAVVVGAGIIGLATAERLLMKGMKVKLLERGQVGRESSWAGAGILSPLFPWNYAEAVTHLAHYSAQLFSEWASVLHAATDIDPEYHQCGMYIFPPYDLQAAAYWCSKYGIEMQPLDLPVPFSTEHNRTIEHFQHMEPAIFLPGIAQIRNPRLLRALHRRVIQLGGQVMENCTVHDLTIRQNRVHSLQSSCGTFTADSFIIAAGAWSKGILGNYALDLDIKPICGQMLLFKFDKPPLPAILVKGSSYMIPRKDGHLLIGSTLEDTGFNKQITANARDRLLKDALIYLPQLRKMPLTCQWAGLRPAAPQNIPTIGRHPELANLYMNSGHFRYGVTMAPASADILANDIIHAPQPFDISPYQAGWKKACKPSAMPFLH